MAASRLLCLKCRGEGHVFDDCKVSDEEDKADWMFSEDRMFMGFDIAWKTTEQKICGRCQNLNLVKMLDSHPPWTKQSELVKAFKAGHQSIKNLGKAGSIQLWSDCSVCRCLFAMIPDPNAGAQDVLLLPDWTLNRLAGEDGVEIDNDTKRQSATCLVAVLKPPSSDLPVAIMAHRGDALCLLDSDLEKNKGLGGRQVNHEGLTEDLKSNTSISRWFDVIQKWIDTCAANHGVACVPVRTEELSEVRLLDVESRKIITYPKDGAEYIAISYVWGGVEQPSYRLGDDLGSIKLPKTIEDAIWFTKQLGRRYLWVDSICIDQQDEDDKLNQINRMWSIYRGSYVTLLALSSGSVEEGIPRLGRKEKFSQMTCCIDGKRLVGLMPTLSQHIWVCPWGKRAWTLQEAVLSPRCLYFSDHQVHFECKAMQCCESLDETRSPSHQLSAASVPADQPFVLWMAQQLGPGCLRIDSHSGRLDQYGRKLTLYSFRDMSFPRDGLNAFKGILQKMEEFYPGGWYEGLPVEDLDWALLWRHHYPAERREGFPSWSWAGWKGRLWHGQPRDVTHPRRFPVHLNMYKAVGGELALIFKTDTAQSSGNRRVQIRITNDAIDCAWKDDLSKEAFDLAKYPSAELDKYLFIDGITLQLALDFSRALRWTPSPGQEAVFEIYVRGARCLIGIMALDPVIIQKPADKVRTLVLIARDHLEGFIIHHLMLLKATNRTTVVERGTVIKLLVPLDRLDVLEELSPQRSQVVLA